MACAISSTYPLPCRDNQGGIKAVYVASFNDTSMTFTTGSGTASSLITAVGGATVSFYTVAQRIEQGAATWKNSSSTESGTNYTEPTVIFTVEQIDSVLSNWLNVIAQGTWRVIVLDNLGRYMLYGLKNGMTVSGIDGGPGKGYSDGNKAVVTLVGKEPYIPYQMVNSVAVSLIQ